MSIYTYPMTAESQYRYINGSTSFPYCFYNLGYETNLELRIRCLGVADSLSALYTILNKNGTATTTVMQDVQISSTGVLNIIPTIKYFEIR